MKGKRKSINADKLFISALLLFVTFIVSNIVVTSTFEIGKETILYSVFIYPFVYFFANQITKIYGASKTMAVLFIAIIIQCLVYYFSLDILTNPITTDILVASILAFGISQIINVLAYFGITKSKNVKLMNIFGIYALALLVDGLIFTYIFIGEFTLAFIYALIIRLAVALFLSYIEYKNR